MHVRLVLGSLIADMHKPICFSNNETIHAEDSNMNVTHQTLLLQQSGWLPFRNRMGAINKFALADFLHVDVGFNCRLYKDKSRCFHRSNPRLGFVA